MSVVQVNREAESLPFLLGHLSAGADPNGDKDSSALAAIARLTLVELPSHAKTTDKPSSREEGGAVRKAKPASKEPKGGESCQLIPSDVIRHLERADRDRGSGLYGDAERLYKDVLACEPNNDHARNGLDRTRKARDAEQNSPSSTSEAGCGYACLVSFERHEIFLWRAL